LRKNMSPKPSPGPKVGGVVSTTSRRRSKREARGEVRDALPSNKELVLKSTQVLSDKTNRRTIAKPTRETRITVGGESKRLNLASTVWASSPSAPQGNQTNVMQKLAKKAAWGN